MTDKNTEEKLIQTAAQSPAALSFGARSKMSDAYSREEMADFIARYSGELKRQRESLIHLYDEPEEPETDFTELVFDEPEKPVVESPEVLETPAEEPVVSEIPAVEPETAESAAEEPEAEEPAATEVPSVEEPVIEEPSVTEPAAEEPVVEEPVVTETPTEEPPAPPKERYRPRPALIVEGAPLSWYRLVPLMLAAALTPLMAAFRPVPGNTDLIMHLTVMGIAALCIILTVIDALQKKLRFRKSYAYVPAAVYAVFVIVSCACAEDKDAALFGNLGRCEGTLVLMSYMIILCYALISVNSTRDVRAVMLSFVIPMAVIAVLGALKFAGTFGDLPGLKILESLGITSGIVFGERSIGILYFCLAIPVAALLYTKADSRGRWHRWVLAPLLWILVTLCFVNIVSIGSASIFAGLAAALIVGLVVFHKSLKYWTKPLLLMIVALALVMTFTVDSWMPRARQVLAELKGEAEAADRPHLSKIITGDDSVTFELADDSLPDNIVAPGNAGSSAETSLILKLEAENDSITKVTPLTGSGQALTLAQADTEGVYSIEEEPYHSCFKLCIIKNNDALALRVMMPGRDWDFVSIRGQIWLYDAQYDVTDPNDLVRKYAGYEPVYVRLGDTEVSDLISHPAFANGRAAAWAHVLPKLKDTKVLGKGAGCYGLYRPQTDYAYLYSAGLDDAGEVMGTTHSMFLNSAFCTGWISVLALTVLYGVYLVQSVIVYWRRDMEDGLLQYAGAGIFLGVTALLAAALANDSTVCVMPAFYALLGTGLAINRILTGGNIDGIR